MLPEKRFIVQRDSIDLGRVKISRLFRLYLIPTLLGMLSICAVTAADGIFVGRGVGSAGIHDSACCSGVLSVAQNEKTLICISIAAICISGVQRRRANFAHCSEYL